MISAVRRLSVGRVSMIKCFPGSFLNHPCDPKMREFTVEVRHQESGDPRKLSGLPPQFTCLGRKRFGASGETCPWLSSETLVLTFALGPSGYWAYQIVSR